MLDSDVTGDIRALYLQKENEAISDTFGSHSQYTNRKQIEALAEEKTKKGTARPADYMRVLARVKYSWEPKNTPFYKGVAGLSITES